MSSIAYFPALTTREAECKALSRLAGPTKDLLFPVVRLQAWPRKRADFDSYASRSIHELREAFGDRPLALDLALPRTDLDSAIKAAGAAEIAALHDSANGYAAWTTLVSNTPFTPVFQWCDDAANAALQWEALSALGRGVVLRFHRSQAWNASGFNALSQSSFVGADILAVFDCGQIDRNEDLTQLGSAIQPQILARAAALAGANATFVLVGSSFPSEFSSIHPEYSKLEIKERRLYSMLQPSQSVLNAGIQLLYGDHASVFADARPPAFRGAPRVDYPSKWTWAYHRRKEDNGYHIAAQMIMQEDEWDDALFCWGTQEIRRAASGNMKGLNSGTPWTAVRINNHLHQQAHFHEGPGPIEEEWKD